LAPGQDPFSCLARIERHWPILAHKTHAASWSRKLRHSRNAAILGQFSKFELHGVHQISQTVHNLLTLSGGAKANQLHDDPLGNSEMIFTLFVPPAGRFDLTNR
jgi:hypothetical protein